MSVAKIAGTFGATGQSTTAEFRGKFNLRLSGFGVGSVQLEKSYDNEATWEIARAADTADVLPGVIHEEPEGGVIYRWNCTAYTSGTIAYRASQ